MQFEMKWKQLSAAGLQVVGEKMEVNEKEQVFIMVSNFDTVALLPVPVHPSSSSPTDERWKQIWGSWALFCRLGDLSESSWAYVSLHPSPADVSQTQYHPLGISPAPLHLPLFIMQIFFFFFFCSNPACLLDSLFISNIAAVYLFAERVCICAW